ncbi:MAG: RidA family protein [Rhodospirillaceae bacterium]|jgi:enamine deaminase RidA (YjgF/YER057c/UK114 family)|nr:RidA family protein [Rhodospirillaceae bacterium]MBT7551858.1 RidA family protein [Gemmatimonadota bacterium]MBT5298642.1 RidA family protein [Rhodospirillaceae bacterium]MBT5512896.1 RidA family protein [Rhodospirillaceae bacterium]MBT6086534.1 RidA family protein [Rhodospirillaceae bacterium]
MSIEHLDSGDILAQAVVHGDTVYLCGLTPSDRDLDITGQTEEVLAKIDDRLAKCGSDKSKILSATIYVTDLANKPALNEVWKSWLGELNRPARACVGSIELEPGVLVEIMVTAAK